MKCTGVKCSAPIINPNPIADFGLQLAGAIPPLSIPKPSPIEIDAMMQPPVAIPRYPLDNFVFKQKNPYRNLRG